MRVKLNLIQLNINTSKLLPIRFSRIMYHIDTNQLKTVQDLTNDLQFFLTNFLNVDQVVPEIIVDHLKIDDSLLPNNFDTATLIAPT